MAILREFEGSKVTTGAMVSAWSSIFDDCLWGVYTLGKQGRVHWSRVRLLPQFRKNLIFASFGDVFGYISFPSIR